MKDERESEMLRSTGKMREKNGIISMIINLGEKSGMPKYTAFLGLIQAAVLFIPESILASLGVDAQKILEWSPDFVHYYIVNSSFKNAMAIFWALSPFTFLTCTVLYIRHINFSGYQSYLVRRAVRLKKLGKPHDYSLIFGVLVSVILYVWSTTLHHAEPAIFGGFVPAKNRFAMLIIHAGALGLFLPGALAVLVTEVRANFSETKIFKG